MFEPPAHCISTTAVEALEEIELRFGVARMLQDLKIDSMAAEEQL
jgi:hypothetical protein